MSQTPTLFATSSTAKEHPLTETNFIDTIIMEAEKGFVSGTMKNIHLNNHLKAQEAIAYRFAHPFHLLANKICKKNDNFLEYKDKDYPNYNANHILDGKCVAAAGPTGISSLQQFFEEVILNPGKPIKQIIALGHELTTESDKFFKQDYYDYCVSERVNQQIGPYQLTVERISGNPQFDENRHSCFPNGTIQSRLTIHRDADETNHLPAITQQVDVTLFDIVDNTPLKLEHVSTPRHIYSHKTEILWNLYEKSQHEPVLIHCAAGVGRTGQQLLTFELVKHHDQVFNSNDPVIIGNNICHMLEEIRKHRPAAVNTLAQFKEAIRNADILFHYGLDKKLQNEPSAITTMTRQP